MLTRDRMVHHMPITYSHHHMHVGDVGAHRKFEPFYPNFPAQVMEMSEAALYFNAILYYWTGHRPGFEKADRPELDERPKGFA